MCAGSVSSADGPARECYYVREVLHFERDGADLASTASSASLVRVGDRSYPAANGRRNAQAATSACTRWRKTQAHS